MLSVLVYPSTLLAIYTPAYVYANVCLSDQAMEAAVAHLPASIRMRFVRVDLPDGEVEILDDLNDRSWHQIPAKHYFQTKVLSFLQPIDLKPQGA